MTFAVTAGYGIAIWVAAAALIHLSSVARPPWSPDRALVTCQKQSRSV